MLAAILRLRLVLLLALGLLVAVLPQAASADLGGNDPPVAVDDEINTAKGTPGDTDVLVNDSDPDGDILTIVSFTQATNGTVNCLGSSCSYNPTDLGFFGSDSFMYTISDGNGGTDVGTVTVTITATNEQPAADDDFLTVAEDTFGDVDVLDGDTDEDGDPLVVDSLAPEAAHGTVACTTDGTCTYTPEPDFSGSDVFTYDISDPQGGADSGEVFVTVTPVNDPPIAVDDTLTTNEDELKSLNVRLNDTDVDGDTLQVITDTPTAAHGTVNCLGGGGCSYEPDLDYNGPDSFEYTISDGTDTDTGTVSVTVLPEDIAPVADDETITTAEDVAKSVNVLAGDTDPDGDPLSVSTPAPTAGHGTVSCAAGGSCIYTPEANYNGSDFFEYSVSDGRGKSDTGLVTVTVTAVNDAPGAVDDTLTAAEDDSGLADVLANDTDVEGDSLTVTGSTNGAHGTVACDLEGTCTYTSAPNYAGSDAFTYTVSDGNGGTDTGSVSVTVTPENDAPAADDDALATQLNTAGTVDVLAGDVDVDGDTLAIEADAWSDPEHGSVSCEEASGVCTYTPDADYLGADSFTYLVTDGLVTDEGLVSVTVEAPNVLPSCAPVKPSKMKLWPPEHQLVVIKLSGATDPDGDTLTYAITGVTQDEKTTKVAGKGDKKPDAQRVSGHANQIRLRAERDLKSNGRVYRIAYRVSDGRGGSCTGVEKVGVPLKQSKNAVETARSYNSFR